MVKYKISMIKHECFVAGAFAPAEQKTVVFLILIDGEWELKEARYNYLAQGNALVPQASTFPRYDSHREYNRIWSIINIAFNNFDDIEPIWEDNLPDGGYLKVFHPDVEFILPE